MTINHGFTIGAAAILNESYQLGIIKKKYTAFEKEVTDQQPKKQQPSFFFIHIESPRLYNLSCEFKCLI